MEPATEPPPSEGVPEIVAAIDAEPPGGVEAPPENRAPGEAREVGKDGEEGEGGGRGVATARRGRKSKRGRGRGVSATKRVVEARVSEMENGDGVVKKKRGRKPKSLGLLAERGGGNGGGEDPPEAEKSELLVPKSEEKVKHEGDDQQMANAGEEKGGEKSEFVAEEDEEEKAKAMEEGGGDSLLKSRLRTRTTRVVYTDGEELDFGDGEWVSGKKRGRKSGPRKVAAAGNGTFGGSDSEGKMYVGGDGNGVSGEGPKKRGRKCGKKEVTAAGTKDLRKGLLGNGESLIQETGNGLKETCLYNDLDQDRDGEVLREVCGEDQDQEKLGKNKLDPKV